MTPTQLETLNLHRDGPILTIELNRPNSLNALTVQSADDIVAALRIAAEPDVRAVILTGAGRAFSSGADLKAPMSDRAETPSGPPQFDIALRERFNPSIRAMRDLPKPIVAAVNGPCAGIAVSYALAADFVLAAESAYFLLAFVGIGLVPDGGLSALIPARIGIGRFNEMAMLGDRIPAPKAHEWGLIDGVTPDGELLSRAEELARRLASGPTEAIGLIKKMVNEGPLKGLDDALELEATMQGTRGASAEFVEGVSAFLEKRRPDFAKAG
jgi:2-(1,2-epoxy-1,2-dihydrophenyl)acetyl-CoA isomerase